MQKILVCELIPHLPNALQKPWISQNAECQLKGKKHKWESKLSRLILSPGMQKKSSQHFKTIVLQIQTIQIYGYKKGNPSFKLNRLNTVLSERRNAPSCIFLLFWIPNVVQTCVTQEVIKRGQSQCQLQELSSASLRMFRKEDIN